MFDRVIPATLADFDAIWQLYVDVCAQQAHDRYTARWQLGIYPTPETIRQDLEAGILYMGLIDDRVMAAMVLTEREDPEYESVAWPTACKPDEVSAIHLLAVHPSARGKHLGMALAQEAIRIARGKGKRAVHLDVVPGNLAASRIYKQVGFNFVCMHSLFYDDIGRMDFELYEYVL